MKRLTIKKLIVISQSESRSLEVPFEDGLNIILGGNKTGKSSIIKSIFTTLESVKELKVIGRNSFPLICYLLNTEKNSFVLSDKVENFRFLKISATIIPVLLKQKPFMNTVIV